MSAAIHAALVTGKGEIRMIEFPAPQPSPGKAVVEIACCGICGTDLHAYQVGGSYNPAICGHEWTGTVSAAGAAEPVREGDRVAIGIAAACGNCRTCRSGDAEHCESAFAGLVGMGPMAASHGGFAPAIAIDSSRLYPVADELSDVQAALLEPATVALHAVRRTPLRLGDTVAVIGAGPVGLLTLQCARAAGAGRLIVIEPRAGRRELARQLGAHDVVDPTAGEQALAALAVDVAFECAGVPETVQQAVSLVRRGGVVSLVGVATAPAEIDAAGWLVKEVTLTASLGYLRHEFAMTQALVQDRRLVLEPLHTSTVPLTDIQPAFDRLGADVDQVKILVDPR